MKGLRQTLENRQLTENLVHKIQISGNEENLYLKVEYMGGRFVIEKSFRNNYFGAGELEAQTKKLDTEEKVRQYLGLGDKNGK